MRSIIFLMCYIGQAEKQDLIYLNMSRFLNYGNKMTHLGAFELVPPSDHCHH